MKAIFKSRKFIIAMMCLVAAIVIAVTAVCFMVPSWRSYKEYYDAAIAEREHQKYLNSLPLEFVGISASVADGVVYYDNGRATPKRSDFTVTAHFTEKGKEYDELLDSDDYTLDVPGDFAQNGGTVTISYTYTPESAGDEAAEPVTKTAELSFSLEEVRLETLEVTAMPYRVAYAANAEFDPEGMAAEAHYNDGSVLSVPADELTVVTTGALEAGTSSAEVSWSDGKDTISANVPITVSANYTDGKVLSIAAEGDVYLYEGQALADAKPVIRATYENGNRLIVTDASEYTVKGNISTASFMKNCILTITMNDNADASCRVAATVRNGIDAEDATSGVTSKEVQGYTIGADGEYVAETAKSTVVEGAASITFTVNSKMTAKTGFSLRVANRTDADTGTITSVALADCVRLLVNGRYVPIDRACVLPGQTGEDVAKYVFIDVILPDIALNAGDNTVQLIFNEDVGYIAVDRIDLTTKFDGTLYTCVADSISVGAQAGVESELSAEMVKEWYTAKASNSDTVALYAHGMCTDGEYLYIVHTAYVANKGNREAIVERLDPETGESVIALATDPCITEKYAGISYYDGNIILMCTDGSRLATSAASFSANSKFEPYEGYAFEGLESEPLLDVYYNEERETFAVWAGSNIWMYDKDGTRLRSLSVATDSLGSAKRMTASEDYIYINYSSNGLYTPVLHVYDWDGNYIGRTTIPCTLSDLGGTDALGSLNNVNTQGICCMGDDFYFASIQWNGDSGYAAIMQAVLSDTVEDRELSLNFGEYLAACADGDYTPAFEVYEAKNTGSYGLVDGVNRGYAMGGTSDGTYIYIAYNPNAEIDGKSNTGNNLTTVIYKIDPATSKVVAYSTAFSTGATETNEGDNSQLFIKDGNLYCVVFGSKVYSISLASFAQDCILRETSEIPLGNIAVNGTEGAKGVYWNEEAGRYAVIDYSSHLYILDEEGEVLKTVDLEVPSGMKSVASVTGDDKYIYVSFYQNGMGTLPFNTFTWEGDAVGSGAPSGIRIAASNGNYNAQAIFFHDGDMYVTFCVWSGSSGAGLYLWTIDTDLTAFDAPTGIDVAYNGKGIHAGGSVSKSDFTVTVIYADGTRTVVTDFELSALADGKVTVSYTEEGKTVSETVAVPTIVPESISVEYKGSTALTVKDTLSKDDFTVTVKYSDGSEAAVTDFTISTDKWTEGEVTVTVSCTVEGKALTNDSIKLTVTNPAESIKVAYTGETTLEYGTKIDTSKITVTVTYADGSTENVTNFTVTPDEFKTLGETPVTVTWNDGSKDFSDTIKVNVTNPAKSITVKYSGKNEFTVGDSISKSDFTVTVTYANGATENVTDFTVTPDKLMTAGDITITVTCTVGGKTFTNNSTTVKVTGVSATAESISVVYNGGDKEVGDTLSKDDFTVKVKYSDDSEVTVTDFTISPEKLTETGNVTVTVKWTNGTEELTGTAQITVTNPATGIEVTYKGGDKVVGSTLSKEDFTVNVKYADGSTKPTSDFTISPEKLDTVGEATVTVTWNDFSKDVTVTVTNPAESISVVYNGETALTVGDSIRKDDFIVTVTYADESTNTVTDFTLSQTKFDEPGDVTVTVTYGTLTDTSVQLTVFPSLGYAIANGGTVGSSVTPINDQLGKIDTTGYGEYLDLTMGSVYYDGVLYVAAYNNGITGGVSQRTYTTIYKIDPVTFEVLDYFEFKTSQSGDGAQLFVHKGILYCLNLNPAFEVYRINVDEADFTNSTAYKLSATELDAVWGLGDDNELSATAATANAEGKVALIAGDHMYFYGADGRQITKVLFKEEVTDVSGYTIKSMTSDEMYIYLQCATNAGQNIRILVFDWEGNYIGTCAPACANMGNTSYNIQSIVAAAGGKMYAAVCSWQSGAVNIFLWEITFSLNA